MSSLQITTCPWRFKRRVTRVSPTVSVACPRAPSRRPAIRSASPTTITYARNAVRAWSSFDQLRYVSAGKPPFSICPIDVNRSIRWPRSSMHRTSMAPRFKTPGISENAVQEKVFSAPTGNPPSTKPFHDSSLLLASAHLNFPKDYFRSARTRRWIVNAIGKLHKSVVFSPEVSILDSSQSTVNLLFDFSRSSSEWTSRSDCHAHHLGSSTQPFSAETQLDQPVVVRRTSLSGDEKDHRSTATDHHLQALATVHRRRWRDDHARLVQRIPANGRSIDLQCLRYGSISVIRDRDLLVSTLPVVTARFGHGLINPVFYRLNSTLDPIPEGNLLLRDAFFSPWRVKEQGGIDPLLRGMFGVAAKIKLPQQIVNVELTERLFHVTRAISLDLAAANVQRSRDHGLQSYTAWRRFCELPPAMIKDFDDLRHDIRDQETRNTLRDVYKHVDQHRCLGRRNAGRSIYHGRQGWTPFPLFDRQTVQSWLRDGDRWAWIDKERGLSKPVFHRVMTTDHRRYWHEKQGIFTPEQMAVVAENLLGESALWEWRSDRSNPTQCFQLNAMYPRDYVPCGQIEDVNLEPWRPTTVRLLLLKENMAGPNAGRRVWLRPSKYIRKSLFV